MCVDFKLDFKSACTAGGRNKRPKQACISYVAVSGVAHRILVKANGKVTPSQVQVTGDDGLSYFEHTCKEEAQVGGGGATAR